MTIMTYTHSFQRLSNISIVACFMLFSSMAVSNEFNLPDLGDSSVSVISPAEEVIIGKKFMQQAKRSLPYIIDAEVEAYLEHLGQTLTKHIDNDRIPFQFYLVNAPVINAFAVPGGHITLYSGLVTATNNENELASVVAHEITHVTQKHLPRIIQNNKESTLPTAATILAGILVGGQAGAAAIVSANALSVENQLTYSRAFESEADSLGMQLMSKSGYHPDGMTSFFTVLQGHSSAGKLSVPEYLRTHPLTINRITDAQLRAQQHKGEVNPSSKDYYFMREKIRAYSPNVDKARLVESFKARLNDNIAYPNAIRFGYAYALMNHKKYDEALDNTAQLLKAEPNNPYYHNLQAQIYADMGQLEKANEVMAAAVKQHPNNTSLQKDYVDLLLKEGSFQQALDLLRNLLVYTPVNAHLFEKAAKAYGGLGDKFNTHLYLADFYTLRGYYSVANEQLDLAKKHINGSYFNETLLSTKRKKVIEDENTIKNSKF